MAEKKYYWLKLKDNFFEQEDTKLVEGMKNGKDYIIFLLKLQLKSINTDGYLLYKNTIPYSEDMLAIITNTDVDIVRNALKVFLDLGMIERLDNGALFMEEVQKLTGAETEWAEKKREWRNKQLIKDNVLKLSEPSPSEVRQEIDKEIDIEIKNIYSGFSSNPVLVQALNDFDKMRKSIKNGKMTDRAKELMLKELSKIADTDEKKIAILEQSILNNWKSIYPLKEAEQTKKGNQAKPNTFKNFEERKYNSKSLEDKLLAVSSKELI